MAKLILEIINRQGRLVSRHLINEPFVTVGRGYTNGVILPDPFVSPEHIFISREEGGWKVLDLTSQNGLFKKEDESPQPQLILKSGEEFRIGKTCLRILSPDHPVPPAVKLPSSTYRRKSGAADYYGLVSTIFIALLMFFAKQYLNSAAEVDLEKLFAKTLLVMPFSLLWAGGWAFLGKVTRQKHFFCLQLQITMLCIILILVLSTSLEYVEYNARNTTLVIYLQIICFGLLAGYALSRHLLVATCMGLHKVRKVATAMVCGIIGGSCFVYYAITTDFDPNPRYSLTLKPPLGKIRKSLSIDNFFKENRTLFKKLGSASNSQ